MGEGKIMERPSRAGDIEDEFNVWWEAIQMKNMEESIPENSSCMYVQMSQSGRARSWRTFYAK